MAVLLTGFEPFGGAERNPSWEAVQLVPETVAGHAVHRLRLPVEYGRAAEILLAEVRRLQPEVVLCCSGVTPELAALNYRMASIPDNAGRQFSGEPIRPGGETAFMTRLPVQAMAEAIRALEIPAWVSLSAGAYVCNDLYYHLLEAERELGCCGLFVHVPEEKDIDAPRAARALTACLETALKTE